MTARERRHPALLNGSRRASIERGSGTTPADVNRLLKQFQQMAKMMSKLYRAGMKDMIRGLQGMMRSEECRVRTEGVSPCRCSGARENSKKKKIEKKDRGEK